MTAKTKIFVALDTGDQDQVLDYARTFAPLGLGLKLGLTYFMRQGPQGLRAVQDAAPTCPIFLDLKLHDIPAQVGGAVESVAALNVDYLTLHASGGPEMVIAARASINRLRSPMKLLSVTVLTSMNDALLTAVGQHTPVEDQVERLGRCAVDSGSHGLVCSPLEIERLRGALGPDVVLMVPGIRMDKVAGDDQKRVLTPREAMDKGATHLVIGRPITGASDPVKAAEAILESLV